MQSRWARSDDRCTGGCNFCDRHIRTDPPGVAPHDVLIMTGMYVEARACADCVQELRSVAKEGKTRPPLAAESNDALVAEIKRRLTGGS